MSDPITSVAHYRVKPGCEEELLEIIDRHWITLRELEFVTEREAEVYLGWEQGIEGPLVIEIFDWVDEDASGRAHTHPEVSGAWEAMGPLCEARGGRPPFEFYDGRRLQNR
jgi:hypothetical protein